MATRDWDHDMVDAMNRMMRRLDEQLIETMDGRRKHFPNVIDVDAIEIVPELPPGDG